MCKMRTSIILHGPNNALNNNAACDLAAHFVLCDPNKNKRGSDDEINSAIQHISDRIHPSVFVSDDLSIETMHAMQEFLAQKPLVGTNKCAIIQNCNNMLKPAANSCLKVIEESGENNLIIITTESVASLLMTIRSRCYKVYIKDSFCDIYNFSNENQYISYKLKNIDQEFLTRIISFITREDQKKHRDIDGINSSKILESIKSLDEDNLQYIPSISMHYLEFKMHHDRNNSIVYAKRASKINKILMSSQSQDQNYLALICILYCIS